MENNNKDLMGWDAPGSNNHNDEEKKRSQDNDPWGRSSRSSNDEFNFSKFIDELMEMLGFKKKGSGSSGKTSKSSFNVIPLVALIVLGFYAFTGFYTVKEAERGVVYESYSNKAQELLTGTVLRIEMDSIRIKTNSAERNISFSDIRDIE